MPAGGHSYSYISTMSGNGVCSRSVEITSQGNGPPRVVSHSSGNCDPAIGGSTGAATLPATPARPTRQPDLLYTQNGSSQPRPAKQPDVVLTRSAQPYANIVRQVAAAPR
jgi:hypothetical protein